MLWPRCHRSVPSPWALSFLGVQGAWLAVARALLVMDLSAVGPVLCSSESSSAGLGRPSCCGGWVATAFASRPGIVILLLRPWIWWYLGLMFNGLTWLGLSYLFMCAMKYHRAEAIRRSRNSGEEQA